MTTFSSPSFFHSYFFHLGDMKQCRRWKCFTVPNILVWPLDIQLMSLANTWLFSSLSPSLFLKVCFLFCAELTVKKITADLIGNFPVCTGLFMLCLTVERKYAVTGISCLHIASGLLSTFHSPFRIDLWHLFHSYIIHMPFSHIPKS